MIRKLILSTVAASLVTISSFSAVSTASASDQGFEVAPVRNGGGISGEAIVASIAVGVIAGLLGAEIKVQNNNRGNGGFNDGQRRFKNGGKHQNVSFKSCKDVPILGGERGNKVVGFREVCR